jgi:hypothetical protein
VTGVVELLGNDPVATAPGSDFVWLPSALSSPIFHAVCAFGFKKKPNGEMISPLGFLASTRRLRRLY